MARLEPLPLGRRRALMRKEATGVLKGAWLGAPSMQALSCLSGEPVVVLHERHLTTAESDFSRYFMLVLHYPDSRELLYETVLRGVLQKYPRARMLLKTRVHFDYFLADAPSMSDSADSDEVGEGGDGLSEGGSSTEGEYTGHYLDSSSDDDRSLSSPRSGTDSDDDGWSLVGGRTEWQGRGMPHIHILVWLERPDGTPLLQVPSDVDKYITASAPFRVPEKALREEPPRSAL